MKLKSTLKSKKVLIPTVVIALLLVAWFGTNLYLFIQIREYADLYGGVDLMNLTPVKMIDEHTDLEGERVYLMGMDFIFPFKADDITHVYPSGLPEWKKNRNKIMFIEMKSEDGDRTSIMISSLSYPFPKSETNRSLWSRFKMNLLGKDNDSFAEQTHRSFYARYDDFSWWNVRENYKLSILMMLKSYNHPYPKLSYKIYDFENPYLRAFIQDSEVKRKSVLDNIVNFDIYDNDILYSIFYMRGNDESYRRLWDIFPTVRLTEDVEAAYREMEAKYNGAVPTELPRELIIVSMMSLKEPTPELVEELIAVMEEKGYYESAIKRMREELEKLKNAFRDTIP